MPSNSHRLSLLSDIIIDMCHHTLYHQLFAYMKKCVSSEFVSWWNGPVGKVLAVHSNLIPGSQITKVRCVIPAFLSEMGDRGDSHQQKWKTLPFKARTDTWKLSTDLHLHTVAHSMCAHTHKNVYLWLIRTIEKRSTSWTWNVNYCCEGVGWEMFPACHVSPLKAIRGNRATTSHIQRICRAF